jgi:uncharacterized SAM-binding protein YcdF (DUF218 family)
MLATLRHLARRHLIGAVIVVALILGSLLAWPFRSAILTAGADLWAVSDRIEAPADAVIVLGGQYGFRPRTRAAADLFRRGLARRVLVSNPDEPALPAGQPTDAEINKALLRKLGVPDSAIFVFGNRLADTYAEARAALAWAQETRAQSVILPVEWFFSRRAGWIFRQEVGRAGVRVRMVSLNSVEPAPNDWWRQSGGIDLFRAEILKYFYYRLKY